MQPDAQFSTAGLPKAFLHSMRTLFDILDDGRRGYVHISEIESRWRGAETPPGVLESLRRIAPHHGCLTFERFVSGLRNSMLNPKNSSRTAASKPPHDSTECKVRPLGPSNAINTQRSRQMSRDRLHGVSVGGFDRAACSVRMGKKPLHSSRTRAIESLALESPNGQKARLDAGWKAGWTGLDAGPGCCRVSGAGRVGCLHNCLKQMKELEQEKDSLLAGLDVLDRAREWYQTQIHNVIETQRHVGQSHSTASSTGSCPSRLDVLLPKLQDVTRCLSDLISFSATTFPSAVVSPPASVPAPPQAIQVIKEQNRLLTQEVSEKSDRITQLEQEKSALIKQLFEARARNTHDSSVLDSTFI
ncbi:putative suppressor APC domain-containing protein 2 [Triplophysa rosa]|uniref:Suppressor APC domain-containing protein 2 n=1 Tax=Triplophysa rosa TaxID=992332 RepID=A0A9W7X245_TRIRA|nr:putative suppressor APC domain-containing protein 2 [Triplophysa rosa]